MNQARKFKALMNRPGIITAPGVYDGIGARIVQDEGFEAVYMTGNGAMASLLGRPDMGLATMSEMVTRAHQLASCVDIPLLCDADTGYGGLGNVRRTVEEFEAAGVAGIHIEDQIVQKKCGALGGVKVVPLEEALERIRVALKSRSSEDFTIIARTDARAAVGFDEALRRARAFAAAGADLIMVEMLESREELERVIEEVKTPILYNIFESHEDAICSVDELEQMGVKVAINCLTYTMAVTGTLKQMIHDFKVTRSTRSGARQMIPMSEYTRLLGIEREVTIQKLLREEKG